MSHGTAFAVRTIVDTHTHIHGVAAAIALEAKKQWTSIVVPEHAQHCKRMPLCDCIEEQFSVYCLT